MEIEKTINKWFEEAQSELAKANGSPVINGVCRSVTAVLKRYCDAAIVLLDNDFNLPPMAHLRIMSELVIKFLWCLKEEKSERIEEQIKRWDLTSLLKEESLYNNLAKTSNEELRRFAKERIEYLNELHQIIENKHLEPMPWRTVDLLNEMVDVFKEDKYRIYVSRFAQFHRAVHINAFILSESVKERGGSFEFTGDVDANKDDLKGCCLACCYTFLEKIYDFYKWDFSEIKRECQIICEQSDNIKT